VISVVCCVECAGSKYTVEKQHSSDAGTFVADMKSGPAAVIRNLRAAFGDNPRKDGMRLIVMDRFYTCVALTLQLLLFGFYSVGTAQPHRLGFAKAVTDRRKTRPHTVARGTCAITEAEGVPTMYAVSWIDSKPVHFLTVGGNIKMDRVVIQHEVACPRVIKDYHKFMGGVDVHDQLRLQRYSLQRSYKFTKYYKALFLGLVDLAIVNAYIVHKAYHARIGTKPLRHVQFLKQLHIDLCQLRQEDMTQQNLCGQCKYVAMNMRFYL
jgi:hypothetical protein